MNRLTPEEVRGYERQMDYFGMEFLIAGPRTAKWLEQIGFNMDRVKVVHELPRPEVPQSLCREEDFRPKPEMKKGPRNRWGGIK